MSLAKISAPQLLLLSVILSLSGLWGVSSPAEAESNSRVIVVPDKGIEIQLWDETNQAGEVDSYVRVVRNGQVVGRTRATRDEVQLAGVSFDPLTDGMPAVAETLQARDDNRLFLVQLFASALPEFQQEIREQGGAIHRYYTEHTLLVEMEPATKAEVESLPFVRWVGPYAPAFRVESALRDALTGDAPDLADERYSIMTLRRGGEAKQEVAQRIQELGGRIDVMTADGYRFEATLSPAVLLALAHDDRVHYIDRWGGPMETDMDIVREVGGADYVEVEGGFTGQGTRIEVFDSELRVSHQEWMTSPIIHNPDGLGTGGTPHGTSCTSNVFAQGISASARGVVPDAQPIFFRADEAAVFGGTESRHTIAGQLMDPAGPYRAVLQTSSVGSSRTFFYTSISADTDDALFLNQVLHTQSQSNAGNQDSRPQAWAKNIVSVGGFRHFGTADRSDDLWQASASIGPAEDGRIKPDLSFFYDGIFSASNSSDTSYTSFGGTSSATPQTAGYFGLLFQMWHEGVWRGHGGGPTVFDSRPKMATAKALMINNAHRYDWNDGSNADMDRFKQGWGTADAANLYDNAASTTVFDENVVLEHGETFVYQVEVGPGEPEFRATMVYVDPMGTVGGGVNRINDLTLMVISPSSVIYWGNNGLLAGNTSTSGGLSNTIDTVENVFVVNPEPGQWTVEVLADEVVQDAHLETNQVDADFALVVFPAVATLFSDGFESGNVTAWSSSSP
ncbi:MAG: S8 family serine peptidase [Thermoanaerobaculia bacterium]|nr:S8 family serine peptidase [Thermoanaerobaculia bacterium]